MRGIFGGDIRNGPQARLSMASRYEGGGGPTASLLLAVAVVCWELTGVAVGLMLDAGCEDNVQGCPPNCTRCGNSAMESDKETINRNDTPEEDDDPFFAGAPDDRKSSESSLAVALIFIALFNFGFCCCCWCCCRALDSISDPRNVASGVNPLRGITLRGLLAPQDFRQGTSTAPLRTSDREDQTSADDSAGTPTRKPSVSVVVVQPGGGVEIGVQSENV